MNSTSVVAPFTSSTSARGTRGAGRCAEAPLAAVSTITTMGALGILSLIRRSPKLEGLFSADLTQPARICTLVGRRTVTQFLIVDVAKALTEGKARRIAVNIARRPKLLGHRG